ncbi:DUF4116 domain-containing protein, partial [Clostridioides difficile]|nr:DUF4116 domain-containing protein [Clostridioides difficile]
EALKYVKEQTEEVCLKAVKQDYRMLKYVNKQTEEVCLEAVRQNYRALYYINDKTDNVLIEAIKHASTHDVMEVFKFVEEQTED